MPIRFNLITTDDGFNITVLAPNGEVKATDQSHPAFANIRDLCLASMQGVPVAIEEVISLFDVAAAVTNRFAKLGERVTVKGDVIYFDGDPVGGPLQDQILTFLDAGEDFGPLVKFYEKLATNPLGDVREGLFTWIAGQTADGALTITPDGDLIGYKGFSRITPEWRDGDSVLVPSRRGAGIVNGVEVPCDKFIEQRPGDVVEMPRSRVLHAPSQMCGDGLHIGTWAYASGFCNLTAMVQFSPRDIVSLPDRNSAWKLRVCRYTLIEEVTEPLTGPLYGNAVEDITVVRWDSDLYCDEDCEECYPGAKDEGTVDVGDRIIDEDGDEATVVSYDGNGDAVIRYDSPDYGDALIEGGDVDAGDYYRVTRRHGKGGPTSQAAKGNGLHPAQDAKTGQFTAGRPGSARDAKTGRFGS